jgi:hypothetical protein
LGIFNAGNFLKKQGITSFEYGRREQTNSHQQFRSKI